MNKPGAHALTVLALTTCMVASAGSAAEPVDLSNAEVIITSSTNADYVGMTNTNEQGRFSLNGVPAGGIHVVIRRNGEVVAEGGTVATGGDLSDAQIIGVVVAPPSMSLKSK